MQVVANARSTQSCSIRLIGELGRLARVESMAAPDVPKNAQFVPSVYLTIVITWAAAEGFVFDPLPADGPLP
jgi:hypothetical protein